MNNTELHTRHNSNFHILIHIAKIHNIFIKKFIGNDTVNYYPSPKNSNLTAQKKQLMLPKIAARTTTIARTKQRHGVTLSPVQINKKPCFGAVYGGGCGIR